MFRYCGDLVQVFCYYMDGLYCRNQARRGNLEHPPGAFLDHSAVGIVSVVLELESSLLNGLCAPGSFDNAVIVGSQTVRFSN